MDNKLVDVLVETIQNNDKLRVHMEGEYSKCTSCPLYNEDDGTCIPLKKATEI